VTPAIGGNAFAPDSKEKAKTSRGPIFPLKMFLTESNHQFSSFKRSCFPEILLIFSTLIYLKNCFSIIYIKKNNK